MRETRMARLRWSQVSMLAVGLILAATQAGCQRAVPQPAVATPAAVRSSLPVEALADTIAKDVGSVTRLMEGAGEPIVVFEEVHGSVAGQLEIGIMANRLYEHYGMRSLGLEGAFASD